MRLVGDFTSISILNIFMALSFHRFINRSALPE